MHASNHSHTHGCCHLKPLLYNKPQDLKHFLHLVLGSVQGMCSQTESHLLMWGKMLLYFIFDIYSTFFQVRRSHVCVMKIRLECSKRFILHMLYIFHSYNNYNQLAILWLQLLKWEDFFGIFKGLWGQDKQKGIKDLSGLCETVIDHVSH